MQIKLKSCTILTCDVNKFQFNLKSITFLIEICVTHPITEHIELENNIYLDAFSNKFLVCLSLSIV